MNAVLDLLEKVLTDNDYVLKRTPSTGERDPETLLVSLADDLDLQALVLPGIESELPDVRLLQLFVPLPLQPSKKQLARIRDELPRINFDVPVMAFSVNDDVGVYFRTVQIVPAVPDVGTGAALLDMVNVAHFLAVRYLPLFQQLM